MSNKTRLDKLEKISDERFNATLRLFFDWLAENQTLPEIYADYRLTVQKMDAGVEPFEPADRALLVDFLVEQGQPLDVQPGDETLASAFLARLPVALIDKMRAVGAWID